MRFRPPKAIRVEDDKRVTISARVNQSVREKLKLAASKTPQNLPLASLVEEVLGDYIKFLEKRGDL